MGSGQIDWLEIDSGLPLLTVGQWVKTSYGTGPYRITKVYGPCRCVDEWADGDAYRSEPHYHLLCRKEGDREDYYLNGYRPDGSSVWSDDWIELAKPTA